MTSRPLTLIAVLLLAATLSACAGTIDHCTADSSPPAGSAAGPARD